MTFPHLPAARKRCPALISDNSNSQLNLLTEAFVCEIRRLAEIGRSVVGITTALRIPMSAAQSALTHAYNASDTGECGGQGEAK